MDKIDTVTIDVPLLVRLLELAREDLKTDVQIHNVVTNMVSLSKQKDTLAMEDYAAIAKQPENAAMNRALASINKRLSIVAEQEGEKETEADIRKKIKDLDGVSGDDATKKRRALYDKLEKMKGKKEKASIELAEMNRKEAETLLSVINTFLGGGAKVVSGETSDWAIVFPFRAFQSMKSWLLGNGFKVDENQWDSDEWITFKGNKCMVTLTRKDAGLVSFTLDWM